MTTPNPSHEERITILETRLDTILPTLATKEDIARLEGKMEAMYREQEGKMEAMYRDLAGRMEAMYRQQEGKMEAMYRQQEGKMETMNARQEGKIDGLGNSLLIKFIGAGITIAAIAVAAAKYL